MADGMMNKIGWGCMGCGCSLFGCMILILISILLLFFGIISSITSPENLMEEPEKLEEEPLEGFSIPGISGKTDKIAVIDITGPIVSLGTDSFGQNTIAKDVCSRIRYAGKDPKVKALIINLNTPGGEVTASDEIYDAICQFRKKTGKPAVAMMNSMAASGGYYVAAGCSPIIANKLTLTGSIGVIISTYNYAELFNKIGLKSEIYVSGKMKDMLNGARPRTPEETKIVQDLVYRTYREFVRIVSRSRNIPENEILEGIIGDGRVLDGSQALELKLVDQLGYFRDAVNAAAKAAKLTPGQYTVIRYADTFNFARFITKLSARSGPIQLSLQQIQEKTLKPGMIYFLPADL